MSSRPLQELGHDVLVDSLFPYLDVDDIKNVSLTCKELRAYTQVPSVWHDLFFKTFGLQPNPFTLYKWPEMYRWRSKAGLYTWGVGTAGRLGYNAREVQQEFRTADTFGTHVGVCLPFKVDALGDTIVSDVVAGGYGFTILTAEGKLYGIGEVQEYSSMARRQQPRTGLMMRNPGIRIGGVLHRGENTRIEMPQRVVGVMPTEEESNDTNDKSGAPKTPIGSLTPPLSNSERARPKELHVLKDDAKFISLSSGRRSVLALDDKNRAWVWDWSYAYPGTQLKFTDGIIDRLVSGWDLSCAYVQKEGLHVWHEVGELQNTSHNDDSVKEVRTAIVPGTSNELIKDVVCGQGFLIYLTEAGEVFYVDASDDDSIAKGPTRLQAFQDKLSNNAVFVKLTGAFNKFAMFSSDDEVFTGSKGEIDKPQTIPELQHVGCISIAMGDHHNLALLRGGQLLTWGCESGECGAFGVGQAEQAISKGASSTRAGLVLASPVEVQVDGHVLAIAAAGWQSCAIITQEAAGGQNAKDE